MIEIKKILFDEKNNLEKCFQIRKEVFVKEQKCDPSDEYENEEDSTHFLLIDDNYFEFHNQALHHYKF